jgi:hypothetical protein
MSRSYTKKYLSRVCGGICLNPSIWETDAGRFWVQGQPGIPSKTVSQKNQNSDLCSLLCHKLNQHHWLYKMSIKLIVIWLIQS